MTKLAYNSIIFMLFILGTSLLNMNNAFAENMQKLSNWDVHYIALDSTFITPEVAKAYQISRSRYNALVNISVLDNSKAGKPAKHVSIIGTAKNNLGQFKTLEFSEVTEGDAIYYLAQVAVNNEETVHFSLEISDGTKTQTLKFYQKFYID
ncbi:MAG: DUF4426 domain-containing protein [Colwellia sp.]